ncbi:MAG: PD40 domain-containing protein [Candidatus Omnitrophica bacterium]|nr:PD40 domain-containing protein [Candidatus Omnitrophota bacterium]
MKKIINYVSSSIGVIFAQATEFVSANFEGFLYATFGIIFMGIIIHLSVFISGQVQRKGLYFLKDVFRNIVIFSSLAMIFLSAYIYWMNFHYPADEDYFLRHLTPDTNWVKSENTVYFIKGSELRSMKENGEAQQLVFKDSYPIMEYVFSPDGSYLLIASEGNLTLLHLSTGKTERIDSLKELGEEKGLQGVINSLSWSPDSKKISYEVAQWSAVSGFDNLYIYDLEKKNKSALPNPSRKISSPFWDLQGKSLYYLRYEANDVTYAPYPYDIKVVEVPLDTLYARVVARIPSDSLKVPIQNLLVRDIKLFLEGESMSFGRKRDKKTLSSSRGSVVGIDSSDTLYFIKDNWFQKKLFKVERRQLVGVDYRYKVSNSDLVIDSIEWLPDGRYLIMDHIDFGIVVLDPYLGKIGVLTSEHGRGFGWNIAAIKKAKR